MSRYKTEDGTIVDTKKATASWDEATDWNGNNHISRATGSQWDHQTLHRSSKGRYYIESDSQRQGTMSRAWFVTNEEAAAWLIHNDRELPDDLKESGEAVSE